jgi:hypothetical protein
MQRRSPPRLSASLPEPTQGQADTDVQGLRSSNSKVSLELPQLRFRDSFEGRVIVAGSHAGQPLCAPHPYRKIHLLPRAKRTPLDFAAGWRSLLNRIAS